MPGSLDVIPFLLLDVAIFVVLQLNEANKIFPSVDTAETFYNPVDFICYEQLTSTFAWEKHYMTLF